MARRASLALLTVAIFTACAQPTPEQQVVSDAARALGGVERLQAVKTIVIEGEGTQYNLGQDVVPSASGQTFAMTQYNARSTCRASAPAPSSSACRSSPIGRASRRSGRSRASTRPLATTLLPAARPAASRRRRPTTAAPNFCAIQSRRACGARSGGSADEPSHMRGPVASWRFSRPMAGRSRWPSTPRPSCRRASSRRPTTSIWATSSSARRLPTTRTSTACSFRRDSRQRRTTSPRRR